MGAHLLLVCTPTYDPDSNRIAWRWRARRRTVTHTHQRATLAALVAGAETWAHDLTPTQILRQMGSTAAEEPLSADQELVHAA